MRLTITLVISLLFLSSCGLFKRTVKSKDVERTDTKIVVKTETEEVKKEVEKTETKKDVIQSGSSTIYIPSGSIVEVDSQGNFKGLADSVRVSNKQVDKSIVNSEKQAETALKTVIDSMIKSVNEKKVSKSESTTDWKLYIFIFIFLFVVGILFWRRLR